MNKQEERILEEIINYVKENHKMPTRRYLRDFFNYKSVNSITRYIKSLENQNYLIRNKNNNLILNNYSIFYNQNVKQIKIINSNNEQVNIVTNKNEKYIAYKIHNNYFNKIGILRNDILIIKIKKDLKKGDLGLFKIDNTYRVMKYDYKDGFYILEDNEQILLSKVKVIGKIVIIERKL